MRPLALTIILALLFSGCFPSRTVEYFDGATVPKLSAFNASAKLFFSDGSLILMPKGIQLHGDTVRGIGHRFSLEGDRAAIREYRIPLDSIAAITYYEDGHNGLEVLGSGMFGFLGPLYSFLSIYCLACPKCCFGSCPTVYVGSGDGQLPEAECFSYCISPYTQTPDLDLLARGWDTAQPFHIRVTNEALETHYINSLALLAIEHPPGSMIFPSADGDILGIRDVRVPSRVHNSEGRTVTPLILAKDNKGYQSGTAIFDARARNADPDWLSFPLDGIGEADSVTIVLRLRNTLLSTVLFYDIVLASQGMQALEWTQRMAESRPYALLFTALYEQYSGIRFTIGSDDDFDEVARIGDIGPVAWKEVAVRVPVERGQREIRLEFFPDNVTIDWIGWSVHPLRESDMRMTRLDPTEATNFRNEDISDRLSCVQRHDDNYLVHEPGDNIHLVYDIPDGRLGSVSLMLSSSGYYYEWLRGGWLREHRAGRALNILDRANILAMLHSHWLEKHAGLEEEFFQNRVPLKEVTQ